MILRRAALLAVGDWVRLDAMAKRVLWQVVGLQRPINAGGGRPELEVMLSRGGEDVPLTVRCVTDDLIEVVSIEVVPTDMRGRT